MAAIETKANCVNRIVAVSLYDGAVNIYCSRCVYFAQGD
jgi:hypothetical protein